MDIQTFSHQNIAVIKDLWEKLNDYHRSQSIHFKDHFARFSFDQRIAELLAREKLIIFLALKTGVKIGYCVATVNRGKGEIDSIFVLPEHRGQGVGERLMSQAIQWLDQAHCDDIRVAIAEGNESAMGFYSKFGFAKRFMVMQMRALRGMHDQECE